MTRNAAGPRTLLLAAALLLVGALSGAPAGAVSSPGLFGTDVAVDSEGNSFVFATQIASTGESCVLRKYSPLGQRLWSRQLRTKCEAGGIDIAEDGTVVLAATVFTATASDFWVARYSAGGARIWAKSATKSQNDYLYDVVAAPDGSIYVTGTYYLGPTSANIWTAKYSFSGTRQWARTYATSGTEYGRGVAVAPDGGVYVAGSAGSPSLVWLRRYSPAGGVKWTKTFNPAVYAGAHGIAVAPDQSVYVVGRVVDATSQDLLLLKLSATGVLKWSRTHAGAADASDAGNRVAVAGNGTVYVIGYSTVNALTNTDILTAAYSPTGVKKWYATFNGPADFGEDGRGVAAAPDGSAVFTGYLSRVGHNDLWVKRIQSME